MKNFTIISGVLLAIFSSVFGMSAQTIGLDTDFGQSGMTSSDRAFHGGFAQQVFRQTDGKLVVKGVAFASNNLLIGLARFFPDGSLDTSFGTNGTTTFHRHELGFDQWSSAVIQPDDKILVNGGSGLLRFDRQGNLDTSFGHYGYYTYPGYYGKHMGIQSSGGIVVGGVEQVGGEHKFTLRRIEATGTTDMTFGTNGAASFGDFLNAQEITRVLILPDDGIIAIGRDRNSQEQYRLLIFRFLSNGSPDHSFGNQGVAIQEISQYYAPVDALVEPNGNILIGGQDLLEKVYLVRFLANGDLDAGFGNQGVVGVQNGHAKNGIGGLGLLPDGRIVYSGAASANDKVCIGRFLPNGQPDNSFDGDGYWVGSAMTYDFRYPGLLHYPDGRIILAFGHLNAPHIGFYIESRLPDASLDTDFAAGEGFAETNLKPGNDQLLYAVRQPDGKLVVVCNLAEGNRQAVGLSRFHPNGMLDGSFGDNGFMYAISPTQNLNPKSARLIFDQQGGMLLLCNKNGPQYRNEVCRILSDGTLDASFGTNGYFEHPSASDNFYSIAGLPDEKILLGGTASNGKYLLMRLMPGGRIDSTFGLWGQIEMSVLPGTVPSAIYSLLVKPNGHFLTVGYCRQSQNRGTLVLTAHFPNGVLDPAFGVNGRLISVLNDTVPTALVKEPIAVVTAEGKILVALTYRHSSSTLYKPVVFQINAQGAFQEDFGLNGRVDLLPQTEMHVIQDMLLLPDQKILLTGIRRNNEADFDHMLGILNNNGSPDTTFSQNGFYVETFQAIHSAPQRVFYNDGSDGPQIVTVGEWISSFGKDIDILLAAFKPVKPLAESAPMTPVELPILFPNPVSGNRLFLQMPTLEVTGPIIIEIFDMTGRKVSPSVEYDNGRTKDIIEIQLPDQFKPGVYSLVLQTGVQPVSKIFIYAPK